MAINLSDIDLSGFEVDFAAVLTALSNTLIYQDSDRGGSSTPVEGELGLSDTQTVISQIRWVDPLLIVNDNNNPEAITLNDYYGPGDPANNQTFFLKIEGQDTVSFLVADTFINAGGGFVNFGSLPANVISLLVGLSTGDQLIFASGSATTAVDVDVVVELSTPNPELSITVQRSVAVYRDLSIELVTPLPEVSISAETYVDTSSNITTFVMPIPDTVSDNDLRWSSLSNLLIHPSLVVGGVAAYLSLFWLSAASVGTNYVYTSPFSSGDIGGGAGPNLIPAWESNHIAIIIRNGSRIAYIKGPTHADNASNSTDEPYFWSGPIAANADLADLILNYFPGSEILVTFTDQASIILNDYIFVDIDLQSPAPEINILVTVDKTVSVNLQTPIPEISITLAADRNVPVNLQTPIPEISITLDKFLATIIDITVSLTAPTPELSIVPNSFVPIQRSIVFSLVTPTPEITIVPDRLQFAEPVVSLETTLPEINIVVNVGQYVGPIVELETPLPEIGIVVNVDQFAEPIVSLETPLPEISITLEISGLEQEELAVLSVSIVGSTVVIRLTDPVLSVDNIVLNYIVPVSNPVQNIVAETATSITNLDLVNNT